MSQPRSWGWLIALAVAPIVAYVVHGSSGAWCGWSYSAVGGACRAVILLSLLTGAVAGVLVAVAVRRRNHERLWLFVAAAAGMAAVLGVFAARQFGDYARYGKIEMDDQLCTFASKTLPDCIDTVWGNAAAQSVRRAQPDCYADAEAIRTYSACIDLEDCQQIVDCVAHPQ